MPGWLRARSCICSQLSFPAPSRLYKEISPSVKWLMVHTFINLKASENMGLVVRGGGGCGMVWWPPGLSAGCCKQIVNAISRTSSFVAVNHCNPGSEPHLSPRANHSSFPSGPSSRAGATSEPNHCNPIWLPNPQALLHRRAPQTSGTLRHSAVLRKTAWYPVKLETVSLLH